MLYWYCQEKFAVGHSWDLNRVCTESWILEKVLKFAQQFSRLGKSLENRNKVWKKMVKSLEVFWKLEQVHYKSNFFPVGQIVFNFTCMFAVHRWKGFVSGFFKVYIDHLFDNLESGKRNYCFGKSLEKLLNSGSKNLYEPC